MQYEIIIFPKDKKIPSFIKDAIAEYEKRLGRYCKIKYQIVKKEKDWKQRLEAEEDAILICPAPSTITSPGLSRMLQEEENRGRKRMAWYITDHTELYEAALSSGDKVHPYVISAFDINAAMTGMILYEQIYRAYRIIHNHPYHK